jgi:lauroyl/myristoyl acyltransferase
LDIEPFAKADKTMQDHSPSAHWLAPALPRTQARYVDCDALGGAPYRAPVAIKGKDVWEVFRLFGPQAAIAWLLPQRAWPGAADMLGRLDLALHRRRTEANVKELSALLEGIPNLPSVEEIERGFFASRYLERFLYLRAHRPGGWEPEIRIQGREHVEAAKAAGRGTIFWGSAFAYNDLILKMAVHRLGLRLFHYTRPVHGLSKTRFGIRFLNPVRTSIECRYLGARVCAEERIKDAMEVLRQEAEAGGAISIKIGDRGRRQVSVPLLNGNIQLATGPIGLAKRWNAVLLPTFTLLAADGGFDVIIGAPLDSEEADDEERAKAIVERYSRQLLPHLLAHAEQWRGWRFSIPHAD